MKFTVKLLHVDIAQYLICMIFHLQITEKTNCLTYIFMIAVDRTLFNVNAWIIY